MQLNFINQIKEKNGLNSSLWPCTLWLKWNQQICIKYLISVSEESTVELFEGH